MRLTRENCDDRGDDIDIIYWYGWLGRRKILRLYFWGESIILISYIGVGRTGDARFCVSTGEECDEGREGIDIIYWYGWDGRRKILRLYWVEQTILI